MSTPGNRGLPLRAPLPPVPLWDDDAASRYVAAGLWTGENFAQFLTDRCTRHGDAEALVGTDTHGQLHRLSHLDLLARGRTAAARLAGLGVRPGDRVVLALPNVVEFVEVLHGVFHLGALPVFGLPSHGPTELAQFAGQADAAAVVLAGADAPARYDELVARLPAGHHPPLLVRAEEFAELPAGAVWSPDAGDSARVAFLQLSGGTTGTPKLIPRTHRDYLYSVRAQAEVSGLGAGDRMLVVLPVAHNFAMSSPGVLGALHVGAAVVLSGDPSPGASFRLVASERVTHVALVPPLAQAWISAARRRRPDLGSLRTVQVGGAKLSPTVAAEVGPVLGAGLQQVFGMAEGLVCFTRDDDPSDLVLTTQGRPTSPYDEIRVVDPDDPGEGEVGPGEEGALLTRGPYTVRGYLHGQDRHTDHFTEDGFYRTGDLVRQLPSGHLVVTGRTKDQINRAGEKVATEEIEDLLLAHPDVLDALALGLPDAHLGERVVAVVVVEPGTAAERRRVLPEALRRHVSEAGLAAWKVPEQVHVREAFPSTHVGKNSRRDLRRQLSRDLDTHTPAAAGERSER